jgi:hypothetical protein
MSGTAVSQATGIISVNLLNIAQGQIFQQGLGSINELVQPLHWKENCVSFFQMLQYNHSTVLTVIYVPFCQPLIVSDFLLAKVTSTRHSRLEEQICQQHPEPWGDYMLTIHAPRRQEPLQQPNKEHDPLKDQIHFPTQVQDICMQQHSIPPKMYPLLAGYEIRFFQRLG